MADDPTEEVTIRNTVTLEERSVPSGAAPFFTNDSDWVVLDAAGRKKAQQPTASTKEI